MTQPRVRSWLAAALALTAGCAADLDAPTGQSWEEYRAAATRVVDGREHYLVDWDIPVSLTELRAMYDRAQASIGDVGTRQQASTVNRVNGVNDIWRNSAQMNLTYCVSTAAGTAIHDRLRDEMATAAAAWESVANVNFIHVPAQDASCSANAVNNNVVFRVLSDTTIDGAFAFFPSFAAIDRKVVIDLGDFAFDPETPNVTTPGVLTHELGHVLGLRHEHVRTAASAAACDAEDTSWAAVTSYDVNSTMHYPWCEGNLDSDLHVTALDATGVRTLYPTAAPLLHVEFMGCNGTTPRFIVDWDSPYANPTYDVDKKAGSTGTWTSLYDGPGESLIYNGVNRRSDSLRVRVCTFNGTQCSSFTTRTAYADCSRPPL